MYKLCIAIPTYNGANTIGRNLEQILRIIPKQVELIICDNCSTDETQIICENLLNNFSIQDNIKYYRNNRNEGFDANINYCVQRANAEYVWLFSDNELIVDDNAFLKILQFLNEGDVDFLLLDYSNEIVLDNIHSRYSNGNSYFCDSKFKGGLISNCVVKKSTWLSLNMERYIGCMWIHFAYQMEALAPIRKGSAGYIKDRFFTSIPQNCKWGKNGTFLLVGIRLVEIFSRMEKLGYDKTTMRSAAFVIKGAYPRNIILARISGLKVDKALYKRICSAFEKLDPLIFIDKFFLRCPKFFCYLLFFLSALFRICKSIIKKFLVKIIDYHT